MAARALYLKWRPQRFEDVVGQEHVTQTLKNALRAGRIGHAYLFAGPRGTGKTTMARLLAKAVNCLDPDVEKRPCNECAMCRSINEGRLLDLIEMDAASHTGVDNVREAIRDKVGFRPTEARYKVYVIDEVHMLSTSAFNALLKTLEEPPEHVIFCLATTEPHKILPTILSRCQQFDFHRIPLAKLVARLRYIAGEEGIHVEEEALQFIARAATGSVRDAISLLDQLTAYEDETITIERLRSVLGLGDAQMVHELVTAMIAHEVGHGLDVLHGMVEQGADARQFAQQVTEHLRSLLLLRVGLDPASLDLDAQTQRELGGLVDQVSVRDLIRAIKLFNQAQSDLRGSEQGQLALELAFVEAALADEGPAGEEASPAAPVQPAAQPAETRTAAQPMANAADAPVPPSAPPRSVQRTGTEPEAVERGEAPGAQDEIQEVSLAEVTDSWPAIRQIIRERSRRVEALVNSSEVRGVEGANRVVFEFRSELLSSKLEKEENRRVVEEALSTVLGKPCRIRGVVEGAFVAPAATEGRPFEPAPDAERPVEANAGEQASPAESDAAEGLPDPYQDVIADPVVQDLVRRGGQVTDVQMRSEEEQED